MTTAVIIEGQWPQQRDLPWSRPLLNRWLAVAVLSHIALLVWLVGVELTAPRMAPKLSLRLERSPAPMPPAPAQVRDVRPEDSAPPVTPSQPPAQPVPAVIEPRPIPADVSPPGVPAEAESADVPQPESHAILSRLSRYRLDGQSKLEVPPQTATRPRRLGELPAVDYFPRFHRPPPLLPFAERPLELNFYPPGMHGQLVRTMDRLTPEFGFTTSFGLEIRCVYVLVAVSCGWREK